MNKKTPALKMPTFASKRSKRILQILAISALLIAFAVPAFASSGGGYSGSDVENVMKGMSGFIFSAIKAIGFILMGLGIVQIGLAFKGHDPAQRATGMLCLFGGILIAFSKEIIEVIAGVTI